MRIEFILLLLLGFLPLLYKLGYWQSVFYQKKQDIKLFFGYLVGKQGRKEFSHFITALEFPVFLLSLITTFNQPFGYFLYSILFYFLLIYNVFVIGKIIRKNIIFPVIDKLLGVFIILLSLFLFVIYLYPEYIYVFIMVSLLFVPVYIMISVLILNLKVGKK